MLKYPFLSGIYLPFKIYDKSYIKVLTKNFIAKSRIVLGNDKNSAVVSVRPINLYFGKNSEIFFGNSVCLGPGTSLVVKKNAKLSIDDNTYITSNTHIESVNEISIGKNCAISWGITIIDDDHHEIVNVGSLDRSVFIGNHVWIGCNCTILKGTKIGNNCVVSAGSVVWGNFPDNSMIAGNPAKIINSEVIWK